MPTGKKRPLHPLSLVYPETMGVPLEEMDEIFGEGKVLLSPFGRHLPDLYSQKRSVTMRKKKKNSQKLRRWYVTQTALPAIRLQRVLDQRPQQMMMQQSTELEDGSEAS